MKVRNGIAKAANARGNGPLSRGSSMGFSSKSMTSMHTSSARKRRGQPYSRRSKMDHPGEDTGRKIPRDTAGFLSSAIVVSHDTPLQRTVMDTVPRHTRQCAAAEPERHA